MNSYQSNDESTADVIPAERLTVDGVRTSVLDFTSDTGDGWVNNNRCWKPSPSMKSRCTKKKKGKGRYSPNPAKSRA